MNDASGRSCSGLTSSWLQMISLTLLSISWGDMLPRGVNSPNRGLHQHAAVDSDDLPGNVGGLRPGEERDRVGDVVGRPDATEWNRLHELGPRRLGEVLGGHRGVD